MKSLCRSPAVNRERDRNHFGLPAELAENAGVTVLHKRTNGLRGVDDFEGIEWGGKRGQNLSLRHRQIDHPELEKGMPASQKMLRINVGDGAGRSDIHVAAHEDGAYRRARLDWIRLLGVAGGSDAHDRNNAFGGELRSEPLDCVFGEAAEDQWRVDGFQIAGEILSRRGRKPRAGSLGSEAGNGFCLYRSVGWSAIKRADFEHLGNGSHAGD